MWYCWPACGCPNGARSTPQATRAAYLVGVWVGLIGSRIWYSLQYGGWSFTGGMASWGFVIGAGLASVTYLRWHLGRCSFGDFADSVAPALATGGLTMRIGCFLVGCNFGKPTDLPWGVRYSPESPAFLEQQSRGLIPPGARETLSIHPTQLYEAAFLLLLLLVVLLSKPPIVRRLHRGEYFLGGIVTYSVFRFLVEWIRDDAGGVHFGPFTFAQASSAVAGLSMLAVIILLRQRHTGPDRVSLLATR